MISKVSDTGLAGLDGLGIERLAESSKRRDQLGQEEFFELMVAQLEHQDPLKPTDSQALLGQVAQFATVNGIQELQSTFAGVASALQSSQALQASTLVGREVLVASSKGFLAAEGGLSGAVELPQASAEVSLTIFDAVGQAVRQLSLGAQSAGLAQFRWDGILDNGERAPGGTYLIGANASIGGDTTALEVMTAAKVESVTLGRGAEEMQLNLAGLGPVTPDSVRQLL